MLELALHLGRWWQIKFARSTGNISSSLALLFILYFFFTHPLKIPIHSLLLLSSAWFMSQRALKMSKVEHFAMEPQEKSLKLENTKVLSSRQEHARGASTGSPGLDSPMPSSPSGSTPSPVVNKKISGIPCVAVASRYTAPVHIDVGGSIYTSSLETLTK